MDSILNSVKKVLGITEEYEQFDQDLIIHINSVLMILTQLGVGPDDGFYIKDNSETWEEFVPGKNLEMIKSYVCLKVRMLFDPPQNSVVTEAINKSISEFEWRINAAVDPKTN